MQMNKIIVEPDLFYPIDLGFIIGVPNNNSFDKIVGYLSTDIETWELKHKNGKIAFNDLSEREMEVLKLASNGHKSKEIALILDISLQTIKIHKRNIIRKLGVATTLDAIREYEKK